jgi:GTP-binding protein HflX
VDVSHPNFEEQVKVVDQTLVDIGAINKPTIIIFNKIDLLTETEELSKEDQINNLKNTWMAKAHSPMIFLSAIEKENIDKLKVFLTQLIKKL